jgi:hypothetical protein
MDDEMKARRYLRRSSEWPSPDGIKIYTISIEAGEVDQAPFWERLAIVKAQRTLDWSRIAHFAIFHRGQSCLYMVLVWWANDNEIFTSVSVQTRELMWVEDPAKFSFCLYDMEVFWRERQVYLETMYGPAPDLRGYRSWQGHSKGTSLLTQISSGINDG